MRTLLLTTDDFLESHLNLRQRNDLQVLRDAIVSLNRAGVVVTIDLVPTEPLRMGAYDTVVSVRKARTLTEPIKRAAAPGGTILTVRNTISDHAIDFSQRNADKHYPL